LSGQAGLSFPAPALTHPRTPPLDTTPRRRIKSELADVQFVSFAFDGTTKHGCKYMYSSATYT
jgi:hypothetical protein